MNGPFLRYLFDYDNGSLIRRGESVPSGRIATKGYRQISINGTRYMAHRLVWMYHYDCWPSDQLDHINQNKDDNRIENLRVVDNKQNAENISHYSHNTSGRRGVRFHPKKNIWIAEIKHHKRSMHLGCFKTIIDAVAARIRAERELFTHSVLLTKLLTPSQVLDFNGHSVQASGTKNEH